MNNDADTVTPLDGDGHNVVEPDKGGTPEPVDVGGSDPGAEKRLPPTSPPVEGSEEQDGSKVVLITEVGHAFQPSGEGDPLITDKGTEVDAADAERIIESATENDVLVTEKESD